jgi:methionyl-tRNA synthetase
MKEVPFGNDGNFSNDSFLAKINADLANNIGNLTQRVLSFIYKNCEGKIPAANEFHIEDQTLLSEAYSLLAKIRTNIDSQAIHMAIQSIIDLASKANEYIDTQAPWTLKKTNLDRMHTVLYTLAESIRVIALLLQPFIPSSADKILEIINITKKDFSQLTSEEAFKPGHKINEPTGVFPRIENKQVAVNQQ